MSKKRAATSELNSDNWDREDEPEEAGRFKSVDRDELNKRVIKVARRKFTKPNSEMSKLFGGFSGFNKANPNSPPDVKNTFSFLSKLNGSSGKTTDPPTQSTMPSLLLSPTSVVSPPTDNSVPTKESLYSTKLKALNECIVDWITKWVSKNPTCVLTPVFQDYSKHLESIKEDIEKLNSESKPNEAAPAPEFKFNFSPMHNSTQKTSTEASSPIKENAFNPLKPAETAASATTATSGWLKTGVGSLGETSLSNNPPLFSFSSSKPTFLQNVGAPGASSGTSENKEVDEDEPPVVDFKPVTEDDALFSQRVKVFVKSKETYSDRGVGNLFIKEAKNDKGDKIYQAIVRADTALGNIIFNIRITKDIPTKRVGKNNVMLVCLPTPDSKPPPVAVLLRVKTEQDADNLLAEIDKYK